MIYNLNGNIDFLCGFIIYFSKTQLQKVNISYVIHFNNPSHVIIYTNNTSISLLLLRHS